MSALNVSVNGAAQRPAREKQTAKSRATSLDYVAMAVYQFRRTAMGACSILLDRGLWEDWKQEIRPAAHVAQQRRMRRPEAFRWFGHCANAALRAMGFRKPRWDPECPGRRGSRWILDRALVVA
jgi:hypothetical protein